MASASKEKRKVNWQPVKRAFFLCNENKQLEERTKNASPSIDEGMNLVVLLLFYLNLFL